MDRNRDERRFRAPVCAGCGRELEPRRARYEGSVERRYCKQCAELGGVKEGWKPIAGGTIGRIFRVSTSRRVIPTVSED
ncbi:MAG: hypothetical protein KDD44_04065 [Bdellovibrionales bacterium]|nr:hypothetical protein [Bdellovibrionales bacterium]